ncbi:MAG: hypothetical protein ACI9CB_000579, partial [Rhodothermales bacterium]
YLIQKARDLAEKGIEPTMASDGNLYKVRPMASLNNVSDFEELLLEYGEQLKAVYSEAEAG